MSTYRRTSSTVKHKIWQFRMFSVYEGQLRLKVRESCTDVAWAVFRDNPALESLTRSEFSGNPLILAIKEELTWTGT